MPGAPQGAALHTDNDLVRTSAEHVEDAPGSGVLRWLKFIRAADGAIVALGATTEAAVTDPATNAGLLRYVRGLLTFLRVSDVGLGKAEDTAHASGDTGVGVLAVRRDTPTAGGADNDYVNLSTDATGRLRSLVTVDGTPDVTVDALPTGATATTDASGNVANSSASATLAAGGAGVRTYITGFACTGAGATAAGVVNVTVAGVIGGTLTYTFAVPAGVSVGATPLIVTFPTPVPASADNTAITVTLPALGAGNTNAAAVAHGFQV